MDRYMAFVSCSIHERDEPIVGMVELILERWGFDSYTVGRNVLNPEPPLESIKRAIQESDCIIAIATKRYEEKDTGNWRTFEWLHGECGIGTGLDKPIFVIKDKNVKLEGVVPASTQMIVIDANEPTQLLQEPMKKRIDTYLSNVRDIIQQKRSGEFWDGVAKVAIGIGLLAGAAGLGYAIGKSCEDEEYEDDDE